MTNRHTFRLTAAAAVTALAGFSAHAIEATQWNPQEDPASTTTAASSSDAMLAPTAWTVGRGEATQFRDAIAVDTVATRSSVRDDLRHSRTRRLMNDAGEAGASDAVLARRTEVNAAERETPVATSEDPIAELVASRTTAHPSLYALTTATHEPLLPTNQTLPPLPGEPRVDETMMIAERPLDDSLTVAMR
ncbi:MAG TPA: hypothetical protein VF169_01040 [Albitalea sp.]|uniref:hypothetical protein n=1 Tax=Piscinibacter sp. TaxID=1903157 RepID=UPI002ED1726F